MLVLNKIIQSQCSEQLHFELTAPFRTASFAPNKQNFMNYRFTPLPYLAQLHRVTLTEIFCPSGSKWQQFHQDSLQELVLNEDEKKLLTKEGVNLPSKLPLSKVQDIHLHARM